MNLLVFREGRQPVSGSTLKTALMQQLRNCASGQILPALLRAGEAECAVADADSATPILDGITDALAAALVTGAAPPAIPALLLQLEPISFPENLNVSTPEGFAYYALHPLAFADVLEKINALPAQAVVIGIRSIGTTLSAVMTAALRARGCLAERFSVRPTGHPYDRFTEFLSEQIALVNSGVSGGADFFIVDEGPGISGSSFLSVAEALLRNGVVREKIILVCSYEPHVEKLRAANAPERWRQFRCVPAISKPRLPAGAQTGIEISGGEWRCYFIRDESSWPASWLNFERLKYLSSDRAAPRLFKFLGYGHYGQAVFEREAAVAAAGFGPAPTIESEGFASYPLIDGRPMRAEDLSGSVLARMAAYCAFRVQAFRAECANLDALQQMADHNLAELRFDIPVRLELERPTVVDGRMQPHEWLLTSDGQMLKTDSGSHGDDHFFPGATDIAWDLAGAIVEWEMNDVEAATFLKMYHRASGDEARSRIADFITAYTVFRCAWCMMAANALQGSEEQARLERTAAGYGILLNQEFGQKICNTGLSVFGGASD